MDSLAGYSNSAQSPGRNGSNKSIASKLSDKNQNGKKEKVAPQGACDQTERIADDRHPGEQECP